VYNIRSLLYLCDDVKYFKTSLDGISSFPSENFKRPIRSLPNPIVQVVKRIQESESVNHPLHTAGLVCNKPLKLPANHRDSLVLSKTVNSHKLLTSKMTDFLVKFIKDLACDQDQDH